MACQYVTIDQSLSRISVCNCGMPDVLLLDAHSGGIVRHWESRFLPLGITREQDFVAGSVQEVVQEGARVLLASDGVTEAQDVAGALFGQDRLEDVIDGAAGEPWVCDAIMVAVDDFCGDAQQHDDISMVEIPCCEAVVVREELPAQSVAGPGEASIRVDDGPDDEVDAWEFSIALSGRRLRTADPVPLIISEVQELEGLESQRHALFTILTELYVNALDHGVLGMQSDLKRDAAGFAQYFNERQRRLDALRKGCVRISIEVRNRPAEGGRAVINFQDSGPGFDFERISANCVASAALSGRGIALVKSLCESVQYTEPGNKVEVVYAWQ